MANNIDTLARQLAAKKDISIVKATAEIREVLELIKDIQDGKIDYSELNTLATKVQENVINQLGQQSRFDRGRLRAVTTLSPLRDWPPGRRLLSRAATTKRRLTCG